MKIYFKLEDLNNLNPVAFLRQAGYIPLTSRFSNETSFARRLSSEHYPRFHIYINSLAKDEYYFNLHLDQKKASYQGQTAHSGEYDGDLVKNEAQRLKSLMSNEENIFEL
jgi:hypothetical protein